MWRLSTHARTEREDRARILKQSSQKKFQWKRFTSVSHWFGPHMNWSTPSEAVESSTNSVGSDHNSQEYVGSCSLTTSELWKFDTCICDCIRHLMDSAAGKEKIICQIFDAGKEIHLNGGVFENTIEHSVRLCLQVQVEQQEAARGDCLATGGCKGENKKYVLKTRCRCFFIGRG